MSKTIAFNAIAVTDAEFALGSAEIDRLLPAQVPSEFAAQGNPWHDVSCLVLEEGIGTEHVFLQREGVDVRAALRHIGAVLQSACDDARKVAGVAYLLANWFKYVRVAGATAAAA